jgi:hypothetical protein
VPFGGGNITQGMSFTIDLTITLLADKELKMPLDLSLKAFENVGWLPPLAEETVFLIQLFLPNPLFSVARAEFCDFGCAFSSRCYFGHSSV